MCWSMDFLRDICIRIIIVIAVVTIIRIVVPWFITWAQIPAPIATIINVVLWAVIAIFGIIILFELFGCIGGAGNFSIMPRHTGFLIGPWLRLG